MIGARGFLKREGFEFDKKPNQIDRAFLKMFSKAKAGRIEAIWDQIHMFGASPTLLYAVPETLAQAHMLMSYDRDRYLSGFDWIREKVHQHKPTAILEVGTGTGVLLRFLAADHAAGRYVGIDAESALVNAAPSRDDITLVVGDYLNADIADRFDMIICNFGFDSDRFPLSTTPHSKSQIGDSMFCPGCSDDLAVHLEQYFKAWRKLGAEGASLLLVGRVDSFGFFRAVALAATQQGWSLELEDSTVLRVANAESGSENFPAIVLKAGARNEADVDQLERFWAAR